VPKSKIVYTFFKKASPSSQFYVSSRKRENERVEGQFNEK
jgi:hypothetical protein